MFNNGSILICRDRRTEEVKDSKSIMSQTQILHIILAGLEIIVVYIKQPSIPQA